MWPHLTVTTQHSPNMGEVQVPWICPILILLIWDSFSLQKLLFQQLCKKYSNSKYSKLFAHLFWMLKIVFHQKQEYSIPWPEFHFCIKSWLHSDGCYVSYQPPSLLITLTDQDLDQHPALWMPRHPYSGLNYWGPRELHQRPCIPEPASFALNCAVYFWKNVTQPQLCHPILTDGIWGHL